MARQDYSPYLMHLISAANYEEAKSKLISILMERRIVASNQRIMGKYKCVCFTESPLDAIAKNEAYERYQPIGLIFEKSHIFGLGGRHAIYQEKEEFYNLPESMRWRHMTYDPSSQQKIDFTWEREWRVKGDLEILPQNCWLLLPNQLCADEFVQSLLCIEYEQSQFNFEMYRMILDDDIAIQLASDGVSVANWNIKTVFG